MSQSTNGKGLGHHEGLILGQRYPASVLVLSGAE